mgnify:CR=1 FL=1
MLLHFEKVERVHEEGANDAGADASESLVERVGREERGRRGSGCGGGGHLRRGGWLGGRHAAGSEVGEWEGVKEPSWDLFRGAAAESGVALKPASSV